MGIVVHLSVHWLRSGCALAALWLCWKLALSCAVLGAIEDQLVLLLQLFLLMAEQIYTYYVVYSGIMNV